MFGNLFGKNYKLCEIFKCWKILWNYWGWAIHFYYISMWALCVVLLLCFDSVITQLNAIVFVIMVSWHSAFVAAMMPSWHFVFLAIMMSSWNFFFVAIMMSMWHPVFVADIVSLWCLVMWPSGVFYGFKMVLNNCYKSHGVLCSFMIYILKSFMLHYSYKSVHIITRKMIPRELIWKFPNFIAFFCNMFIIMQLAFPLPPLFTLLSGHCLIPA